MKRGTILVPQMNNCAFTAAIVLLFNVWGMGIRSVVGGGAGGGGAKGGGAKGGGATLGVRADLEKQMADVHICMRFIKKSIGRYVAAFLLLYYYGRLMFFLGGM